MDFAGMNYVAILVAGIAGYMFGALYYGTLGDAWLDAQGKTKADLMGPDGKGSMLPFVLAAIAALVMAFVLAGTIGHLGAGQVTLRNGIISGAFVWAGFIATTVVVNNAYQDKSFKLSLIDAGHWLGVLIIQGAVLGYMGV